MNLFAQMKAVTVFVFIFSQFSFSEFYQYYCNQIYRQIFSFRLQQTFLQFLHLLPHTIYGSRNIMNRPIQHQITTVNGHAIPQEVRH